MNAERTRQDGALRRLLAAVRRDKRLEWAMYAAVLVLSLLLYFAGDSCAGGCDGTDEGPEHTAPAVASGDTLETRLTAVLCRIRGAGKVAVLITYETGGETVAAMASTKDTSIQTAQNTATEQVREVTEPYTVTTDSGEQPIVLMEIAPAVRGVIVVAEGAADPTVRMNLQYAVRAVTGAPLSSIEVFEMTGEE